MIMPFGRYEGTDIKELPDNYLLWLIDNCTDRDDSRYSIGQVKYYARKALAARQIVTQSQDLTEKELAITRKDSIIPTHLDRDVTQ